MAGAGGGGGMAGMGGAGGMGGMAGAAGGGGMAGAAGGGGMGGAAGGGGMGGAAGGGGMGGAAGDGGGCPAGADTPQNVDLRVTLGPVTSYEVVTAGLLVTPGPGSGNLYGNSGGMGTDAIGPVLSIQSGDPNESIAFQVFRSDGVDLGVPEGATDVTLFVNGASTTEFRLAAEDKDGGDLGSATAAIGSNSVDVSALIGGEIHKLTIEATGNAVIVTGIAYTNVCLGYTP